jgi:glutamate N-acetyltransferase/amino-acid N-acetyltransferase
MPRPTNHQLPRGFRYAATACGLKKKGGLDLALIVSDTPATAAAVFTTNRVQAAPVQLSRAHVRRAAARLRAIIVNSGNANCSTGPVGMAAARQTAQALARELGCAAEQAIVCSTGVIGVPLRVEKILAALPPLRAGLAATPQAFESVTRAIMTTDTRPKWAAATCHIGGRTVHLLGCAKGAGMIHPQMATMLAFVVTDAAIAPGLLRRALRDVANRTFNCITVDGDTSTNDTLAVLANGASGASVEAGLSRPFFLGQKGRRKAAATNSYSKFVAALEKVCRSLALQIVADGEGAQRVVEITVRGAASARAADAIARTIANSPLVKTALTGADPNWGRILAAAGRAPLSPRESFDPDQVEIWLAGIKVYSRGRALPFDEKLAHRKMLARYVPIVVDLHQRNKKPKSENRSSARFPRHSSLVTHHCTVWTCDFTHDYVTINASYRT